MRVFKQKNMLLCFIILSALIIRFGMFLFVHPVYPERAFSPDSFEYINPALSLLHTGKYNVSTEPDADPELDRPPGYPIIIAATYYLTGEGNNVALLIIQILIASILLPYLTYLLGKMLVSQKIGLIAAALIAINPGQIVLSFSLLSETFYTVIFTGSLILLVKLVQEKKGLATAALCSILLAAATYIRPVSLYLIVFIVLGLIVIKLLQFWSWRQLVVYGLVLVITFAACLIPWKMRNLKVGGTSLFTTNAARQILKFRAAPVYSDIHNVNLKEATWILENEIYEKTDPNENLYDRQVEYSRGVILGHPWETTKQVAMGVYRSLIGLGTYPIIQYLGLAEETNLKTYSEKEILIKNLKNGNIGLLVFQAGMILIYILTLLFVVIAVAAVGFTTLRNKYDKISKEHFPKDFIASGVILLFIAVYFLLVSAGPEAYSRFRMPILPIITIFAAFGFDWTIKKAFSRKKLSGQKNSISNH